MGLDILIPLLAIFSLIFVPITGIMVILTTRFALKPLAETIAQALRDSGYTGPGAVSDEQIRALTEEVESLRGDIRRLEEMKEFDRKLLDTRED